MAAINDLLRRDLTNPEFSEGYAEAFENAYIATQIKVLREQNEWTQTELAERLSTKQTVISRIENVNYSKWNIGTLRKLARAFRLHLKVSFETYGSLIEDVENFSREGLRRPPRENDIALAVGPERHQSAAFARLAIPAAVTTVVTGYALPTANVGYTSGLVTDTKEAIWGSCLNLLGRREIPGFAAGQSVVEESTTTVVQNAPQAIVSCAPAWHFVQNPSGPLPPKINAGISTELRRPPVPPNPIVVDEAER